MDLRSTQLKDTYGNLVTTGTTAGAPTSGGLQNGQGTLLTAVGIGTNTPATAFEVSANAQFNSSSTDGGFVNILGNNSYIAIGADKGGGAVLKYNANGNLDITPRATFDTVFTSGNVGIGTSSPDVELDVSGEVRASSGILFGTDTASANALDDYEEGTWTPAISSGYTSPTYTNTSGYYTKIGNVVNFTLRLQLTGGTADANQIKISGLPFTSKSGSGTEAGLAIGFCNGTNYDGTQSLYVPNNDTIIEFYEATGSGFSGTEMNDNTFILHASGFYLT